jgi:hypothetical protein
MNLKERIESFSELGKTLRDSLEGKGNTKTSQLNELINNQHLKNEWFTPEYVRMALNAIAYELTFENLTQWCSAYPQLEETAKPVNVGVVMAGNIPLVGFHDFLSVLISGNNLIAKTSSKDSDLINHIADLLTQINPEVKKHLIITDKTLTAFDAVIATGSDNSSRYFEYYFGKYPNIIRKNRSSIALLDGSETDNDLQNLGTDIFSYFGLGCRNVSKVYIPAGYDLAEMTGNWDDYRRHTYHNKYANNYDFNKAVYLVNKENFHDLGHLLLKEERGLSSPVSVLYYEFYDSQSAVKQQTEQLKEKIQCIVGKHNIPFGKAQSPHLWDYADGIDTLHFLLKKKLAGIL